MNFLWKFFFFVILLGNVVQLSRWMDGTFRQKAKPLQMSGHNMFSVSMSWQGMSSHLPYVAWTHVSMRRRGESGAICRPVIPEKTQTNTISAPLCIKSLWTYWLLGFSGLFSSIYRSKRHAKFSSYSPFCCLRENPDR